MELGADQFPQSHRPIEGLHAEAQTEQLRAAQRKPANSGLYHHMPLKMETHTLGEVLVLHCTGRLVYGDEAAAFSARVKHMLLGTNRIVVNLSGMEYIDSGGLGTLVGLLASTRNRHGEIKLVRPTKRVTDLLQQTRLTTVFHTYESDDEAVAAFHDPQLTH